MSVITARSSGASSVGAASARDSDEKQALTPRTTPSETTAGAASASDSSNTTNKRRCCNNSLVSWRSLCIRGGLLVATLTLAQYGLQRALL